MSDRTCLCCRCSSQSSRIARALGGGAKQYVSGVEEERPCLFQITPPHVAPSTVRWLRRQAKEKLGDTQVLRIGDQLIIGDDTIQLDSVEKPKSDDDFAALAPSAAAVSGSPAHSDPVDPTERSTRARADGSEAIDAPQQALPPGDANRDGVFDRYDIIQVLQAAKYLTGEPASWEEGDWNNDGVFDHDDLEDVLDIEMWGE